MSGRKLDSDPCFCCSVQHAPATPLWWIRATLGAIGVLGIMAWGYVDMMTSAMRS
mgnify:FL=1